MRPAMRLFFLGDVLAALVAGALIAAGETAAAIVAGVLVVLVTTVLGVRGLRR